MIHFIKDIMAVINFDVVMAAGLIVLVYCAARKRDSQVKIKHAEVRDKEPEVVWIIK